MAVKKLILREISPQCLRKSYSPYSPEPTFELLTKYLCVQFLLRNNTFRHIQYSEANSNVYITAITQIELQEAKNYPSADSGRSHITQYKQQYREYN